MSERLNEEEGGLAHHVVDAGRAVDAREMAQLLGMGKIDQDGEARLAGAVAAHIAEIVEKLVAVGQAAHGIDPSERMLELDLGHHHRREIVQGRHLGGGGGARFAPSTHKAPSPYPSRVTRGAPA